MATRPEDLVDSAYRHMELMEYDLAEEAIREAAELALAVDDQQATLQALGALGQLRKRQGDHAAALRVARDGFQLAAGIGDRHRVMVFALDEAFALDLLGDTEGAITAARTALTLARESGGTHDLLRALGKLGSLLLRRGDPTDIDDAEEIAGAGLALAEQEQDRVEQVAFLVDVGLVKLLRGEPEAAIEAFGHALLTVYDTGSWNLGSGLVATLATRPTTPEESRVLWFAARAAASLAPVGPEMLRDVFAHFGVMAVVRAVRLDDRPGAEAGLLAVWEVLEDDTDVQPLMREAVRLVLRWYGGYPLDIDSGIVTELDGVLGVDPPLAQLLAEPP